MEMITGLIYVGIPFIIVGFLIIRHIFVVSKRNWFVVVEQYTFKVHVNEKAEGFMPYDWAGIAVALLFILIGIVFVLIDLYILMRSYFSVFFG